MGGMTGCSGTRLAPVGAQAPSESAKTAPTTPVPPPARPTSAPAPQGIHPLGQRAAGACAPPLRGAGGAANPRRDRKAGPGAGHRPGAHRGTLVHRQRTHCAGARSVRRARVARGWRRAAVRGALSGATSSLLRPPRELPGRLPDMLNSPQRPSLLTISPFPLCAPQGFLEPSKAAAMEHFDAAQAKFRACAAKEPGNETFKKTLEMSSKVHAPATRRQSAVLVRGHAHGPSPDAQPQPAPPPLATPQPQAHEYYDEIRAQIQQVRGVGRWLSGKRAGGWGNAPGEWEGRCCGQQTVLFGFCGALGRVWGSTSCAPCAARWCVGSDGQHKTSL